MTQGSEDKLSASSAQERDSGGLNQYSALLVDIDYYEGEELLVLVALAQDPAQYHVVPTYTRNADVGCIRLQDHGDGPHS